MGFAPIETQRLHIRSFVPDDWPALFSYMSDAKTTYFLPEGTLDEEQARAFVTENCGDTAQAFALIHKSTQQLIGHIIFHPWFAPKTYELGWVIHPAYRGHGYVPEAAAALLHYSFTGLMLHRVIATCQPDNKPSYRVMEKIGMRREGWFQKCIPREDGSWWDEYFYAILEEEWYAAAR